MADIFVDPTAITNGAGTQSNPRNIWPASISANDVIYLLAGTRLTVSAQLSLGAGSNNVVKGYYPNGSAPRPIITSTATNQSLISVGRPGITEFNGVHFDQCLGMGSNGGVLGTADNGSGRHASLRVIGCKFTGVGVNAILLNGTTTANAPLSFTAIGNEFDDIGADCVFGAALQYEFSYNRCTRMSAKGAFGDAVGFINGDPEFIWVHHNYIDHSNSDTKQCIIVDSTTPGVGLCMIEDNILIGFGSVTNPALTHNVIISKSVTTTRRNVIYTYGGTGGVNYAGDRFTDNLVIVGNSGPFGNTVAVVADGLAAHNTFINVNPSLALTHAAVAAGVGTTAAARVKNNLFVGFPLALKSDSTTPPAVGRNAYWQCSIRRLGTGAFPETSELLLDPMLTAAYRPRAGSPLISGAEYLGAATDLSGRFRGSFPAVGAFEFPS